MQRYHCAHCELVSYEVTVLAHCDRTGYLTVRDLGELTVSIVLAHTFTGIICYTIGQMPINMRITIKQIMSGAHL